MAICVLANGRLPFYPGERSLLPCKHCVPLCCHWQCATKLPLPVLHTSLLCPQDPAASIVCAAGAAGVTTLYNTQALPQAGIVDHWSCGQHNCKSCCHHDNRCCGSTCYCCLWTCRMHVNTVRLAAPGFFGIAVTAYALP